MAKGGEATLWLKIKTAGEDAIKRVQSALSGLAAVGTAVFTALSAVVVKSIADYREQEKATNALTQAMVNNGNYSKALKDDYLAQAAALQKLTLFGDEQIIAAQAAFTQQVKGVALTKEYTQAILDFAQAQGVDAATAANLVGKSIGTSTNALTRYGIQVTAGASEQQKLNEVMRGLNATFGGQANAATKGLGSLKQLENSISDLFEIIGEKLVPVISILVTWLNNIVNDTEATGKAIGGLMVAFEFAAKVGTVLYNVIAGLSELIGATLGTAVGTTMQLVEGNFRQAYESIKEGASGMGEIVVKRMEDTTSALDTITQAFAEKQQQNAAEEEAFLVQSLNRKAKIREEKNQEQKDKEIADFEQSIADKQTQSDIEIAQIESNELAKEQAILASLQKRYQNEKDHNAKMLLSKQIASQQEIVLEQKKNQAIEMARKDSLSKISTLSNSSNSQLAAIGKAAGLVQIAIDTPVAIGKALAAAPPPFNFALAAGVGAAMAAQAAQISGIQLAEGGIVMPRSGGVQATIAEAGQPEVVIPLDRANEFGLGGGGGGVTIIVNGGLLGDERTAQEFAQAVDRELLKLRQNGGSVAFDRIT